jgi:CDP-glucose 4,6-dehydratase
MKLHIDFWQDKRVLVTGATGLLGSWLIDGLMEFQADPVCLVRDHLPASRIFGKINAGNLTSVHGCLEDFQVIERAINEYEIEIVFHLGAQTIVGVANANPLSTFEANIRGTYHVLEACRRSGRTPVLIVASSDKAYGSVAKLPYDENEPLRGEHPYDVSKSCADLIARSYYTTYGLPVCVTRCGNLFGGGDLNWNRLVPGVIRWGIRGQRPNIRSDGNMLRDYFYVKEAVNAYMLLAEKMAADKPIHGHAFNFSNEIKMTVLELTNKILLLMGRPDITPIVLNKGRNEIHDQYLSAKKARETLGWMPVWDFDDALRETIDWYKAFLNQTPSLRENEPRNEAV